MSAQHALDSLALRGKLTKICAWALIAFASFQLVLSGYFIFKPDVIVVNGGDAAPPLEILPILLGIVPFVSLLANLGLIVCALLWIHRAHSNLRDQGIDLTYSANWAVGSYFVPLINLVVPFRAMRELYNRSHGEIPEHAHSTVEDVSAWWMSYMVGLFLSFGLIFKMAIDLLTNIVFLTPAWMEFTISAFSIISVLVAVYMLTKLVTAITLAQAEGSYVGQTFE